MKYATNSDIALAHTPVLLDQMLNYLQPSGNKVYVDATFGNGGYTKAILESNDQLKLIAIDQDPHVLHIAKGFAHEYSDRFTFIEDNFANLEAIIKPFGKVDGIVWDLGVSSMQLDNVERGFSFSKDAALDMRMSSSGQSAADFVNFASQDQIADVIFYNAGEHHGRKIAKKIVEQRQIQPIHTTKQLADIVRSVVKSRNFSIDPATKTFQAIRIFVNDELTCLERSIQHLALLLNPDARLVWVSFHSLEDSIIKNYLKNNSAKKLAQSKYHHVEQQNGLYEILTHKPVVPSQEEIRVNNRARSAKLRAARKIG